MLLSILAQCDSVGATRLLPSLLALLAGFKKIYIVVAEGLAMEVVFSYGEVKQAMEKNKGIDRRTTIYDDDDEDDHDDDDDTMIICLKRS